MMDVRVVSVDFYMASPRRGLDPMYSDFRGSAVYKVPIIRIFGPSKTGEKTCLHIHGVFPYIYIPYDGIDPVDTVIYQVASNLDKAINVSLNRAASNTQHIFKIKHVSGIPMYGYHYKEHQFLKLYFYNPLIMKKACTLLQNGTVMGKIYQPHEAHLPYILQFMIDFNLHGMSLLSVSKVSFRETPPEEVNSNDEVNETLPKMSVCIKEGDVLAENILNKLDINSMKANPGISAIWEDEKQRRRNDSEDSFISQCLSQERPDVNPTSSHLGMKSILSDRITSREKVAAKVDTNTSIYPAETPDSLHLLNASLVDSHSDKSQQLSMDLTLSDDTIIEEHNNTLGMDTEDIHLCDILQDLKDNVEDIAEDSILTQIIEQNEESEDELDMTLALEEITTPEKTIVLNSNSDEELINLYHIPQVDGANDSEPRYSLRKKKTNKCNSNDEKQNTENKKKLQDNKVGNDVQDVHTGEEAAVSDELVKKCLKRPFLCLDGANDSSSEEEKELSQNKRYNELSIAYQTPTRKFKGVTGEGSPLKYENTIRKKARKCITEDTTALATTIIEENLICQFKGVPDNIAKVEESASIESAGTSKIQKYKMQNFLIEFQSTDTEENVLSKESIKVVSSSLKTQNENICHDKSNKNDSNVNISLAETSTETIKETGVTLEEGQIFLDVNYLSTIKIASKLDYQDNNLPEKLQTDNETSINIIPSDENQTIESSEKSLIIEPLIKLQSDNKTSLSATISEENKTVESSIITPSLCNLSVYKEIKGIKLSSSNCLIPKYNPPTRQQVESTLAEYNIASTINQTPFYSNYLDVTGNVEVGTTILKIPSNTIQDCAEFESSFSGISDYRITKFQTEDQSSKDIKNAIESAVLSCYTTDKRLITPALPPPSRRDIEKDLEMRKLKPVTVEKPKEKKTKIVMPFSPGMEVDYDNSISVSPFTPISVSSSHISLESQSSQNSTPKLQQKKRKSLKKTLLTSLISSQPSISKVDAAEIPKIVIKENAVKAQNSCNVTGVTQENTFNFKMSLENFQDVKASHEHEYITSIVMELHIQSRRDMKPDPTIDPIKAIFYSIMCDAPSNENNLNAAIINYQINETGANLNKSKELFLGKCDLNSDNLTFANSEIEMLLKFTEIIKQWDPDIFIGYEIEMLSWGYLIDRGYVLGINLSNLLSRIALSSQQRYSDEEHDNELKLPGRIILNLWRLMRHEIALQSYTFENIVYHILHERVPLYSFQDLSFWWEHPTNFYRYKVVDYYVYRLKSTFKLIEQLDLIGRTSELARLFGIQFFEVLSRGSQFRVESMMLRLAKPLNFIAVSPSVQQRAKMKAPEFLPLILEPESKFYADPVIVLDFQSLYPSMIIAYNYCFSTCLGKIQHLGSKDAFEFGATHLKISPGRILKLLKKDKLNFSPCGVAFVKSDVRKGILPRMLEEILGTRLMVKKSMKKYKGNKILQRVLHSRQLGLKLIANVTYGYTAANFSGRMPSVEVGDSVVSKGRETLLRAIKLVESTPRWGARVIYGDTDSLFVLTAGKSKEEAFKIGEEIANSVTEDNPAPVKLKLEKVYQPCILQTKKRYVGYMYESADQAEPEFEAKGIETVRRDGCPAVSLMLEKCLKILFDTRDVSKVRQYVERQINKIFLGRISIQDLTFAKEYRGEAGYKPGACVPALELARKWRIVDKRSEPRSGERVPYVIVNGPPGLPLIRLVRSPYDLLNDVSLRPNALYYITKVVIPPLNRCFTLIGADLNQWFNEMPKKQISYLPVVSPSKKSTISQYFNTISCAVCGEQTKKGICEECVEESQKSTVALYSKIMKLEKSYHETKLFCQTCSKTTQDIKCKSLDCPILYHLEQRKRDVQQVPYIQELLLKHF